MNYKRLALIGIIAVIIVIIAVFLWLNAELIIKKIFLDKTTKTEEPVKEPEKNDLFFQGAKEESLPADKIINALEDLKEINRNASSSLPEEKINGLLNDLQEINRSTTTLPGGIIPNVSLPEGNINAMLESLKN